MSERQQEINYCQTICSNFIFQATLLISPVRPFPVPVRPIVTGIDDIPDRFAVDDPVQLAVHFIGQSGDVDQAGIVCRIESLDAGKQGQCGDWTVLDAP